MDDESSQLTLLALEAPARTSAAPDDERDSPERVPACSLRRPGLSENAALLLQFGRTYPAHLAPTLDETFGQSSIHFANSGRMTSRGEYLTLNTPECLNNVAASTLSQILEDDAPARFYLTPRAATGILRRSAKRGKALPPHLHAALAALASTNQADDTKTITT